MQQNLSTWDIAAGRGKKDEKISDHDLKAIAENAATPADQKAAAQFLLDNTPLRNDVDTANGGSVDGIISKADIETWLQNHPA